jgi:hypothetical protein
LIALKYVVKHPRCTTQFIQSPVPRRSRAFFSTFDHCRISELGAIWDDFGSPGFRHLLTTVTLPECTAAPAGRIFDSTKQEVAVMSALPNSSKSKRSRIHLLVAPAIFSVIAACGTGVAAFTGLLPASKSVASEVTAMPLIDIQVAASATSHDVSSRSGQNAVGVEPATRIDHRRVRKHVYVVGEPYSTPSAMPTAAVLDSQAGKREAVLAEPLLPS